MVATVVLIATACPAVPAELPVVTRHPLSRSVLSGNPVSLRASSDLPAAGVSWWRDGRRIAGKTRPLLEIDNVGPEHQGYYRAAFRTAHGATWTREAFLKVIHPAHSGGARDRRFAPPDFGGDDVRALAVLADGRVVAGGEFDRGGGLVRLLPEGRLDAAFNPGGDGADNRVRAVLRTARGYLVGGDFTRFNGLAANGIVLLDHDGSPLLGFRSDLGFDNDVHALAELPDGRYLAAGKFRNVATDAGQRAARYITRLLPDGTADPSFAPEPVGGGPVECFAIDGEGRIVVGGSFTAVGGVAAPRIARLMPDGQRDPSFVTGDVEGGVVNAVAVSAGGEIYVGGGFNRIQGAERQRFARLDADGAIDLAYRKDADQSVRVLTNAPGGGIFVAGRFVELGGEVSRRIARLDGEGEPDPEFQALAIDDGVRALAWTADGRVYAGGQFDEPAPRLVRLFLTQPAPEAPQLLAVPVLPRSWFGERVVLSAIASGGGEMAFEWMRDGELIPYASTHELSIDSVSASDVGSYSVRVTNSEGSEASAVVLVSPRHKLPSAGRRLFAAGVARAIIPGAAVLASADSPPGGWPIGGLAVEIEAEHPNFADVEFSLVAPDGTEAILLPAGRMSTRRLASTRFDDRANATIYQAEAPAAGVYQPAEDLAVFVGKPLAGTWHLKVTDRRGGGTPGFLRSWGIEFESAPSTPDYAGYADHFQREDLLRFALVRAPGEFDGAPLVRMLDGGAELSHDRWPEGVGASYRYERLAGASGWQPVDLPIRDRQRFPDGWDRVSLGLPTGSDLGFFRVVVAP